MGDGDAWPAIREQILASEILVVATPTWLGQLSSVTKRALERMDAFLSETGCRRAQPPPSAHMIWIWSVGRIVTEGRVRFRMMFPSCETASDLV